ncbi:MAG TPA: hypothetical protein VF173_37515 [Thermoanaerobaculia bacterium]|nr:hypothetical protein [Thermoanaerobaculia bacterium]
MKRAFVCLLVFAVFAALPAAAAPVRSIQNGIDVWHTAGDGSTFVDFDKNPIPKGFFCSKSAAFTGKVVLQGRPLATGTPGELGGADTIVQRLDDADFDGSGVATTRVQLRALQLESVAPFKTACGDFNVRVTLSGTQPTTKMKIVRETDVSGHFEAPIEVRFKIVFLPVHGGASSKLQIVRNFSLAPAPNASWGAIIPNKVASRQPTVLVDTDGDMIPDTYLPRTSGNFFAGMDKEWVRNARERQAREKMASQMPLEPTQPIDTCSGTLSYDGYGSYQCNSGPSPQCHPEASQAQHCAQSCPPCYYTVQPVNGTLE